jgi:hypothetical protein
MSDAMSTISSARLASGPNSSSGNVRALHCIR